MATAKYLYSPFDDRRHGGVRKGAGRKKKDSTEVVQLVSIYLSAEDREYLMSWGVKPSDAARRLIDRARKMWAKGE